jgi:hypothetical protein
MEMVRQMHKDDIYRKYVLDEMSRNKEYSLVDIEHFVASLGYDQAKQLCKYFSSLRRNCVYEFISKGPNNWQTSNVNISNIYVGDINRQVNYYLERNNWLLKNIVEDNDIYHVDEFKSQGPIDIKILSFIAKKNDYEYTIIDGMHRAIRSACDGKTRFKLIYY